MDWSRIESDINRTASSLRTRNISTFDIGNSFDVSSSLYNPGPTTFSSQKVESTVSNDMYELKSIIGTQNQRMSSMERMIRNLSDLLEQTSTIQQEYAERLNHFESDLELVSKTTNNFGLRDKNDTYTLLSKTLNFKLLQIEENISKLEETSVSKQAFTQLLDTSMNQLQIVSKVADHALTNSNAFTSFAETFFMSLWDLQNKAGGTGSGHSGYRLDFLLSLTPEGQREQMTRLLRESIGSCIKSPLATQIETTNKSWTAALEDLRLQMSKWAEETHARQVMKINTLEERIDRHSDVSAHMESILKSQRTFNRDMVAVQDRLRVIDDQRLEWTETFTRSTANSTRLTDSISRLNIEVNEIMAQVAKLTAANTLGRQLNSSIISSSTTAMNNTSSRQMNESVEDISSTLESMRQDQEGFGEILDGLQIGVKKQGQGMSELRDRLSAVEEQGRGVTRLQQSQAEVGETLSNLAQSLAKIQQQCQQQQQQYQQQQQQQSEVIATIQEKHSEYIVLIKDFQLNNIPESIGRLMEGQDAIQEELTDLHKLNDSMLLDVQENIQQLQNRMTCLETEWGKYCSDDRMTTSSVNMQVHTGKVNSDLKFLSVTSTVADTLMIRKSQSQSQSNEAVQTNESELEDDESPKSTAIIDETRAVPLTADTDLTTKSAIPETQLSSDKMFCPDRDILLSGKEEQVQLQEAEQDVVDDRQSEDDDEEDDDEVEVEDEVEDEDNEVSDSDLLSSKDNDEDRSSEDNNNESSTGSEASIASIAVVTSSVTPSMVDGKISSILQVPSKDDEVEDTDKDQMTNRAQDDSHAKFLSKDITGEFVSGDRIESHPPAMDVSQSAASTVRPETPMTVSATREQTSQCPLCLKRIPKDEISLHHNSFCELRKEFCRLGCGAKVIFLQMEKHMLICSKNKTA